MSETVKNEAGTDETGLSVTAGLAAISAHLTEAAALVKAALVCARAGSEREAVRIVLDLDVPLSEAQTLHGAVCLIGRITLGDLDRDTAQALAGLACGRTEGAAGRGRGPGRGGAEPGAEGAAAAIALPLPDRRGHTPGVQLAREWGGRMHTVTVLEGGYAWDGANYPSLSRVAQAITGTKWNGPRFFGLRERSERSERATGAGRERGERRVTA